MNETSSTVSCPFKYRTDIESLSFNFTFPLMSIESVLQDLNFISKRFLLLKPSYPSLICSHPVIVPVLRQKHIPGTLQTFLDFPNRSGF